MYIYWRINANMMHLMGIILGMDSANEKWYSIVTSLLIGWAHIQNDPWPQQWSHIFQNWHTDVHCTNKFMRKISSIFPIYTHKICIWVRSWRCGCLVTWFCYHLIAKPGNKTAASSWPDPYCFITLGPRQNGCQFPGGIFKCIFLNENVWISLKMSLKFCSYDLN